METAFGKEFGGLAQGDIKTKRKNSLNASQNIVNASADHTTTGVLKKQSQ